MLIQHWWDYLFHVLIVPVGLFAVIGADRALTRWPSFRSRLALVVVLALCSMPVTAQFWTKLSTVAVNGFGADQSGRDLIHDRFAARYAPARAWRVDLRDDERPVHFIGDATSLWVSGRDQAIPVHGWAADFLDPVLWARMTDDLATIRPVHLWLWSGTYDLMDRRAPDALRLVEREYCFVQRYGDHDWWALRSEVEAGTVTRPCDEG